MNESCNTGVRGKRAAQEQGGPLLVGCVAVCCSALQCVEVCCSGCLSGMGCRVYMSHVTVMSHVTLTRMSHVTHMNESRHTYE